MTKTRALPEPTVAPAPAGGLRWDDPRLRAWIAFLQAHASVARRLEVELEAAHGISLAEYDALVHLASADQRRLRMSELADQVLLSRSGVSRLVDRLAASGLVERAGCPSDARVAWATLTPTGLEALATAAPVHLRGVQEHFLDAMDADDRDALARALEAVTARLRQTAAGATEAPCEPAAPALPAAAGVPVARA